MTTIWRDASARRLFCFVVLFSFAYVAFYAALVGSLPLDAVDDYARLVNAKNASWSAIGQALLPGRQPATLLGNDMTSLMDRTGQTLFLKILYRLFDEQAVFYYLFQYVTGAFTMALLAWFAFRLTRSFWLSAFAAFFYFFLPPAFMHNVWLSDFAETVHVLILVSFLIFLFLNERYFRQGRLPGDAGGWALAAFFVLSAFLALKIKPSGYIIPLSTLLFFFVPPHKALFKNRVFLAVLALAFVCGAALFPYKTLGSLSGGSLHFDSIFKMIFMNTKNEFDSEKTSALFNLNSVVPVSLARILGFFIAWPAIILGGWRLGFRHPITVKDETRLLMIWFGLEVLFFALNSTEARYLTDSFLPLVLLLCVLFKNSWDDLDNRIIRQAILVVLLVGISFNTVNNIQHLIFVRNWRAGLRTVLHAPLNTVYNDFYRQPVSKDNSFEDIIGFIHPDYVKRAPGTTIYDLAAFCDIPDIAAFCGIPGISIRSYVETRADAILERYGKAYWITQEGKLPPEGFELIASVRKIPESPLTHWLASYKKKKHDETLLIFRKTPGLRP